MAEFYTPPQFYADQPAVKLLVEFDHGDTGLPLIDATNHLVDLLQTVQLELIYSHWRDVSSMSDITYERTVARARAELRLLNIDRISYNSPLQTIIAAPEVISSYVAAFGQIQNLFYGFQQRRESRTNRSIEQQIADMQQQHLDEIAGYRSLSKKKRRELEEMQAAEQRLIMGVRTISSFAPPE